MWAAELVGPGEIRIIDVAPIGVPLAPGEVLLRFEAGGVCGSDVPKYLGFLDPRDPQRRQPGYPLHEVVGRVVDSRASGLAVGRRVVGVPRASSGLAEYLVVDATHVHPIGRDVDAADAVVLQPVATVLSAVSRLPPVEGLMIAVIGLGPIGLAFAHVLKSAGAGSVIGVDPVDRSDVAASYGVDTLISASSSEWVEAIQDARRPDVVIEAVGHQQRTLADAVRAAAFRGHVFAFGSPDDEHYVVPFRAVFVKNLSIQAGNTQDWRRFLAQAEEHVLAHWDVFKSYVSHRFPFAEAQAAYQLYARPAVARRKVVLTA